MAKRRANRGTGASLGKGYPGTRRRTSNESGQTIAGLAVVAAVLAGGTYLYRHTTGSPGGAAITPEVRSSAAPAAGRGPTSPVSTAPVPNSLIAGGKEDHPSAATPSASVFRTAPFGTSEEVFEGGARLYTANCAGCHGRPGQNAKGPSAAQFWDRDNAAGSHAIAQPVGSIYQATAIGNLVQGMPSYGQRLTDTQLWDLALLLKSANQDLPEPVLRLLHTSR